MYNASSEQPFYDCLGEESSISDIAFLDERDVEFQELLITHQVAQHAFSRCVVDFRYYIMWENPEACLVFFCASC
uniref:Uncharacterized protein n=1 Tax=Steinernema glaseri TaxID=37863 RepID=A0A1I7YZ45_9BILA